MLRKLVTIVMAGLLAVSIYPINHTNALSQHQNNSALAQMQSAKEDIVAGEVIVQFKKGISEKKVAAKNGLAVEEKVGDKIALVSFDEKKKTTEDVVGQLSKDQAVVNVQPNYKYKAAGFTNDPYLNRQWGLHNTGQIINGTAGRRDADINLPEAWSLTKGMKMREVVVAVIDSGVDINHPDLAGSIWRNEAEASGRAGVDDDQNGYVDDVNGWNFRDNNNAVFASATEDSHGTHVAGIIAASINNSRGIAGIAPNAKIMPLKFISGKEGNTMDAIRAIQYAKANGAQIVNASWGSYGGYQGDVLERAIMDSGMLFIAAAGNEANNNDLTPSYPASYSSSNILSVAAIDNRGRLASFSNFGISTVDLAAPGASILSTVPRSASSGLQDYVYYDGTSMAAPYVAGAAALMLGARPEIAPEKMIRVLTSTGKPLVTDVYKVSSGKYIDAEAALIAITPLELESVNDLFSDEEYVEGRVSEPAEISIEIEEGGTYSGKTDNAGNFKIKTSKLKAGTKVIIRANVGKRASNREVVTVQERKITTPMHRIPDLLNTKEFETNHHTAVDKVWKINFNKPVKMSTVTENNIYVTDYSKRLVPVQLHVKAGEESIVEVSPVNNYERGAQYTLWVKDVVSASGIPLKRSVKMSFEVGE